MICDAADFSTARLRVRDWHSLPDPALARFVSGLLTPEVTRWLPASWQISLGPAETPSWIAARDAQGSILVALDRDQPIGVLTLYESVGVEVYVGYVLARGAWGQGYASELLAGFVRWCRGQPEINRLMAGVTTANLRSIRVLEKCGFVAVDDTSDLLRYSLDNILS